MAAIARLKISKKKQKKLSQSSTVLVKMPKSLPEHLMDTVTAVGGSSPAYVYMLIEAMADAAIVESVLNLNLVQLICTRRCKNGS